MEGPALTGIRGCGGHWIYGRASLLAQAEAVDQRAVGLDVLALEVVEQAAALAHHGEQPAARMEILDVRLEMLGEHVDPLGEERDLHFGRFFFKQKTAYEITV